MAVSQSALERIQSLSKDPGLFLIDLENDLPEMWPAILRSRGYKQWAKLEALGLKQEALADSLQSLTFKSIVDYMDNLGPLSWQLPDKRKWQCSWVEDNDFKFDYYFTLVFSYLLSTNKRLPTEDEFWKMWLQLNGSAMQHNMSYMMDGSTPTSCAAAMYVYSKKSNLGWDKAKIQEMILRGAEFRCKKAFAGLLREFYTILALTVEIQPENIRKPQSPCTTWWHPLLDCVAKCDAIVQPQNSDQLPTFLAIYLNSRTSRGHIKDHKNNGMLSGKLLNAAVESVLYKQVENGIYLPEENLIFKLRMAINGNKEAIMQMQGYYT